MGIAANHKQAVLAQQQAEEAAETAAPSMEGASEYEKMMLQISEHKTTLSNTQSQAKKIDLKKEFLPQYDAYIQGVLDADSGVQDDVLITVMIWCVDAGAYQRGLILSHYAFKHGMAMPERFKRGIKAFVIEQMADATKEDSGPNLSDLLSAQFFLGDDDIHDEIKAKLWKALGLRYEQHENYSQALFYYEEAVNLNGRLNIKQKIKALKKQVAAEASEEAAKPAAIAEPKPATKPKPAKKPRTTKKTNTAQKKE